MRVVVRLLGREVLSVELGYLDEVLPAAPSIEASGGGQFEQAGRPGFGFGIEDVEVRR